MTDPILWLLYGLMLAPFVAPFFIAAWLIIDHIHVRATVRQFFRDRDRDRQWRMRCPPSRQR